MPDYKKAGEIRRGEHDAELPDYEIIASWLQRAPQTWLPALLRQCVASCVVGKVFQEGKLVPYVERCEAIAKDPNSMLRTEE